SGEGADEVWGGYIHQLTLGMMDTADRFLPRGWSRVAGWLVGHAPTSFIDRLFPYPSALGRQGQTIFSRFLRDHASGSLSAEYLELASLYRPGDKSAMYTTEFAASLAAEDNLPAALQRYFTPGRSALANAMQLDLQNWLPSYTLLRQDKLGFANSLEIRVPYLDHRIVEFAMEQPDRYKIR